MIGMTITIYNCKCGHDYVNKTPHLTQLAQYTGTVRDAVNVVNPVILIDANVISGNYCYIDTFDSYYYIDEKTIDSDNLTNIICTRDPFMTALSGIMSAPCICARSGIKYNGDFADNEYHFLQNNEVQIIALSSLDVPNTDTIVLAYVE